MQYKYSLPHKPSFSFESIMGFIYSDEKDFSRMDALRVMVDGASGVVTTGPCDRIYLVLVGTGTFIIEGVSHSVTVDDVMIIPRNTEYEYQGSMELFEVNTPAFPVQT